MMCLAVPGKIVEVFEENGLKMGRVDYAGTVQQACLEYVPQATQGEYVIVHAGFAISLLDEEEAQKSFAVWDEMIKGAEAEGVDVFGSPLKKDGPS